MKNEVFGAQSKDPGRTPAGVRSLLSKSDLSGSHTNNCYVVHRAYRSHILSAKARSYSDQEFGQLLDDKLANGKWQKVFARKRPLRKRVLIEKNSFRLNVSDFTFVTFTASRWEAEKWSVFVQAHLFPRCGKYASFGWSSQ